MYIYVSDCCKAKAKKPALVKPKRDEKQENGLGHWRCSNCGKKSKVTRQSNKD